MRILLPSQKKKKSVLFLLFYMNPRTDPTSGSELVIHLLSTEIMWCGESTGVGFKPSILIST